MPKPDKMTQFRIDQLQRLIGFEIVGVDYDPSDPSMEPIVGLRLKLHRDKEVTLWILADDEGNGPGSFDIQPL